MFSVVIPVYNHGRFLPEAVKSALGCDLVKEILLCDDGSRDDSSEICQKLAIEHSVIVKNLSDIPSRNLGAHHRLNQLCRAATQPWIRILNSDDYFLPCSFESLRILALSERADFISGSMLICDEQGVARGTKKGVFDPEYPLPKKIAPARILRNKEILQLLLNQNFIATTTNMAFRRELFDKIGGFSDFRYAHDLDFALRATKHGNCIWSAAFLATYRVHGANTISEVSPHMDGEITRLYANFLADFPEIESDSVSREFLKANRHIAPFPESPNINIPSITGDQERIFLFPSKLPDSAIPNTLLALGTMNYDFIMISKSLIDPPSAVVTSLQDCISANDKIIPFQQDGKFPSGRYRGRLLRCPPREKTGEVSTLLDIFGANADIEGSDIHIGGRSEAKFQLRADILDALKRKLKADQSQKKPIIFVLPIFLAVGGVERNTIEVINKLKDQYQFVVITTEFLTERLGSLHWQLEKLSVAVFDLAEIASQKHHMEILAVLTVLFPPDLVWICNGSPWLVENSVQIRRLFANTPIVDQEVYDTAEGWIAHYNKKGIQSFDYFVAINSKIRAKFIEQFRIPSHRVSLIYHAINEESLASANAKLKICSHKLKELNIPEKFEKVFIFVGRLTDQKQPMSFLQFVKLSQENHPSNFFLMVGDGDMAFDCDQFITDHQLDNIRRIPYHPCPPELMALANGMIITSIYEGLPIAMLEALAVGIPILATDVGDIRLILEEYGSGLVSNHTDLQGKPAMNIETWDKFMRELLNYSNAAKNNSKNIISRFGTNEISKKYNSIFSIKSNYLNK